MVRKRHKCSISKLQRLTFECVILKTLWRASFQFSVRLLVVKLLLYVKSEIIWSEKEKKGLKQQIGKVV